MDEATIHACLRHAQGLAYRPLGAPQEKQPVWPCILRAFRQIFGVKPLQRLKLEEALFAGSVQPHALILAEVVSHMVLDLEKRAD